VLENRLSLLRAVYQAKRTVLEQALRRELGGHVTWPEPKGGFFLWASFRQGIDTDALLRRAIAHGVVFVPGSAFYVEPRQLDRARLSFSAPPPAQIEAAVARLAGAVREELELRGTSGAGRSADLAAPRTGPEGPSRE
jgi:2-aminoadipate transaminase